MNQPSKPKTPKPISHLPFLIGNRCLLAARPRCFLWKYPTLTPPTSTVLVADGWQKAVADAKRFGRTMWVQNGQYLLPCSLLGRAYPSLWPETSPVGVADGGCRRWDRRTAVGIAGWGFPFLPNGFSAFTLFHIFYFLLCVIVISEAFFFFFLKQGQNRHPLSIFVNQRPSWIYPYDGGPNRVIPRKIKIKKN